MYYILKNYATLYIKILSFLTSSKLWPFTIIYKSKGCKHQIELEMHKINWHIF